MPSYSSSPRSNRSARRAASERLPLIREARLYARLLKEYGGTQRELARELGISQPRLSQRLSLLELPREVLRLLEKAAPHLTERHLRWIRRLPERSLQIEVAGRVEADRLSVPDTEVMVRNLLGPIGSRTSRQSGWREAPGLRWRRHDQWLEVEVRGKSPRQHVAALTRLIRLLSQTR